VVEVVSRIAPLGPVLVGLSDEGTNPRQAPHNCECCTGSFRDALAAFNRTQDPSGLRALSCDCRQRWLAEVGHDP